MHYVYCRKIDFNLLLNNKFNIMFGFTDWFSSIATYVMSWYEKFDDISDGDSEEEWGQFVVIDEEKI